MGLLKRIEMREVFLEAHTPIPYNGTVQYDISDGWSMGVVVSSGLFAHFAWIAHPDADKRIYYGGMSPTLREFIPTTETQGVQYGFHKTRDDSLA